MKIAIFGASSYIAKDLIYSFSSNETVSLDLFGRQTEEISNWLKVNSLDNNYCALNYSEFSDLTSYDAIINFVGVGNPAQAIKMGAFIFDVTCQFDQIALDYLQQHPDTKYIFLSSGAVYGTNFVEPVNSGSFSCIDINTSLSNDWYSKAKLYTEIRHRSKPKFNIVDLRVFNYFSSSMNISTSYFICDVLRHIMNQEVLQTSQDNIYRDYLHLADFYQIVNCILATDKINMALDCYSKAPIDKITILEEMKEKFGLRYSFTSSNTVYPSLNYKKNYYSLNKVAESIGYFPAMTSIECLLQEAEKLIKGNIYTIGTHGLLSIVQDECILNPDVLTNE